MESDASRPTWLILLALLGFFSLAKFSIHLLHFIYTFFLRPSKNLKTRYGSWAVITGATDGIGKAIAFELAHQALNLIIVGRNPDKLQAVSESLRQQYPTTQIRTVTIDLSANDMKAGLQQLREVIEGLDVGILINNAGVSNRFATFFDEGEIETWMDIVNVNVRGVTEVTRTVLPEMLRRKRGAVVNIGSGSALMPYPLFAVYSGTKAYIDQFSRSLHVEYMNSGIDVQCHHPYYVATRMVSKVAKVRWYNPSIASSDAYARATVRWIGYEPRCIPYLPHFIQFYMFGLVPDFISEYLLLRINMAQRKAFRKRRN